MEVPPTMLVPLGVITAGLIAGFFSLLGLINAKGSKISEFRQSWINDLRQEISRYATSVHLLVTLESHHREPLNALEKSLQVNEVAVQVSKKMELAAPHLENAVNSLSLIYMMLNNDHTKTEGTLEKALLDSVIVSRKLFNDGDYEGASEACDKIRENAAPLLKGEWTRVKRGELGYRVIRGTLTIIIFVVLLGFCAITFPLYANLFVK